MRIAFIGKFNKLHDEEYIARSFESIGNEVRRINEKLSPYEIKEHLDDFKPDIVIWTKLSVPDANKTREISKPYKTVCWVFDLYIGYQREHRLNHPAFTADFVFTTDGGHDKEFKELGINHKCVRQGIYKDECFMTEGTPENKVVFIGSENPYYPERTEMMSKLSKKYNFKWYGRLNTNEMRGTELNKLFSEVKIVVGDSVTSPKYWSNRIVETLGRGGFLIHREVEGLKEEYPDLVTYDGTFEDLCAKIDYYLEHEEERKEIIRKNFELVRDNYTMDKKCQELLDYVQIQ